MKKVLFSPRATADLDEIWDYTADRWDIEQADSYIRLIVSACSKLAEGTFQGRSAEEIRIGYRKYPVVSHVVFYMETPTTFTVIRILHQQMDMSRHFD